MKRSLKLALVCVILTGTITAFVLYAKGHPEVVHKIRDITPGMIALLMLCFTLWFASLVFILHVTLRMFDKTLSRQENILLNAYSSLVNFFGPAQSGPAFRGLYLKKRHGLKFKHYIFGTLLYYALYAILSAFLLFVGSRPWWQTAILVIAAGISSIAVLKWYTRRSKLSDQPGINLRNLSWLLVGTAVQMVAQVGMFYIEVHSVDPGASFAQILTYTGASNFALFASITPGAIGIREAFLVFSQNLHHISNTAIVAANIIDRAAYLIFLGVLFVLVLALHAKEKLHVSSVRQQDKAA
jgi:uncharacterized membrane protein YbhN (UPF0104 family)